MRKDTRGCLSIVREAWSLMTEVSNCRWVIARQAPAADDRVQSWTWKELQEPLQYRMTAYFTLRIVDQRQVYIRMRGQKTIFDVGNRFAAACTVDVGHGALGATLHAGGSHSEASTLRTTLSSTQRISKSAVLVSVEDALSFWLLTPL